MAEGVLQLYIFTSKYLTVIIDISPTDAHAHSVLMQPDNFSKIA